MFPVFSVSISAISVDGYDVSTRVVNESGVYEEFSNTIVFNASANRLIITVDIELPEVIPEDTVFDLEVEFSIDDYLTISEYNGGGTMHDSNWLQLEGKLDGIVKDGKLIESQILATGDVKYIRYVFDIYGPIWDIVNIPSNGDDSIVGTWVFNETLKLDTFDVQAIYNVNFVSNVQNYIRLILTKGTVYYGYGDRFGDVTAVYNGDWEDAVYRTINITSILDEVTNGDALLSWLKANATFQSSNTQAVQYTFDFAVTSVTLTQDEEDTGIFAGILGWVKKIFNSILDLPNKIADMIKGLFVPSEKSIIELKDKFEALFADRFGAAYQSIEVVEQFGQAMGISTYSDTVDTITFPSVTVPLAGTEFTFGGWEVDLVPKGFEGLITPLKLIVDLVCTIACVNMFRRRMEGVLR